MNVNEKLNSKNVAELRKLATCYDIAGRSTMKKAELIDKLIDAGVETRLAIDEITPEQEARHAEQYRAAQADAESIDEAIGRDVEAGTYSYTNEVAILRDAPGRAIVTAAFDGRTVGGSIVRKGKTLVLTAGSVRVTGNTFAKVAKRFAKALGFRVEIIDVARSF